MSSSLPSSTTSPVVSVPEQHANAVDDVGLTELDSDALAVVAGDGVRCVALLSVVVLCVSVEEDISDLTLDRACVVLGCGHVLIRNWEWREGEGEWEKEETREGEEQRREKEDEEEQEEDEDEEEEEVTI